MTDLPYPLAAARPARPSWLVILYAAGAGAGAFGLAAAFGGQTDGGPIEWQLGVLMRFMAGVKALMVVAAFALAHWRLRAPIGAPVALGYVASLALMALAPGLIWSMAHVVLGATCFHVGLLVFLVMAWRDDGKLAPARFRRVWIGPSAEVAESFDSAPLDELRPSPSGCSPTAA